MTLAKSPTQLDTTAIGPAVVPLIAVVLFINYVDRGNLATAAPLMKDELGLSGIQIGVLLSAFFWSYVPARILAGWLTERINPYRTPAVGLALWSIGIPTAISSRDPEDRTGRLHLRTAAAGRLLFGRPARLYHACRLLPVVGIERRRHSLGSMRQERAA